MRKKSLVIILLLACFVGITCFLVNKIVERQSQNEEIKLTKEYLPKFEFYQLDSAIYLSTSIKKNIPLIIIHFNTECEHCQAEVQLISQNIKVFKNAQIIMVAPNAPSEINSFMEQYGIKQHSKINVLWDKYYHFIDWFGHSPFPSVYIYNKGQHLVKEYHGEVKIEALTKYLN
ncbi:redoxin domain-containing protein [Pelobium sp.]|nr:redoxin domain-containing protein [Pelobium sp.]MDA9555153.1 redoxin domain-containing protein [Pelobium sp.]